MHDCRIVGTLVVLNPGPGTDFGRTNTVNWEPAVPNYPALLVSGNIEISITAGTLYETSQSGSYNPPGTPYEGFAVTEDADDADTYPSVIKGLVYVSGNLQTRNHLVLDGVLVVGGSLDATAGDISLTYQPTFLNNPPPGFGSAGTMAVSPGTWQRVVN